MAVTLFAPDLTQHAPRSPRVKLGGYVHLPRLLDKARAQLAGKNGDYHYECPLDAHFFAFTGLDPAALLAVSGTGKTDTEVLEWIREQTKRLPAEIAAWSDWLSRHAPGGEEGHAWFAEVLQTIAPGRDDVSTFFDLLDLDDYVTFGGKS